MFPGQGSQQIGMGKQLSEQSAVAKEVFAEIDDALEQKLSDLMFTGSIADLSVSENTQPALMAHSMAIIRVIEKQFAIPIETISQALVGHSLGEYSALAAAGVFSLTDAAKLLRLRGQAMQQAVVFGEGAMAAILGLEVEIIEKITEEASSSPDNFCTLANDNSSGQAVISGHINAVTHALELAKIHGAKRTVTLPVSVPSHCKLMQPAADIMRDAFEKVQFNSPKLPVFANFSMQATTETSQIKVDLVKQLCFRVRFRETIVNLANDGHILFAEIGTNKVLSGLVKRIVPNCKIYTISNLQDIENFLHSQQSV